MVFDVGGYIGHRVSQGQGKHLGLAHAHRGQQASHAGRGFEVGQLLAQGGRIRGYGHRLGLSRGRAAGTAGLEEGRPEGETGEKSFQHRRESIPRGFDRFLPTRSLRTVREGR